jgi:GH15 family glucan-1,4-alpha-glucosidase
VTSATKLYFGNLPYNCDNALLAGNIVQVRFFQHFDANLYGNDTGDSAYYDPRSQAVVHYKGRRYFLISGSSGGSAYGLSSFAIGQKDAPGKEGTWRDAEDGELSRNPVAQGSIDSVGMVNVTVAPRGSATAVFWIGCAAASFLDGRLVFTADKATVESTRGPWIFDHKFYLILNLAVGGDFPGPVDGTTPFPSRMTVDYVRVYQ